MELQLLVHPPALTMNQTLFSSVIIVTTLVLGGCREARNDPATERGSSPARAETPAAAELTRADFGVEGMDCGGCVIGTRMALRKLDGVVEADASYDEVTGEGAAWARYDPSNVTPEQMMAAIRDLGYTPTLVDAGSGR